MLLDYLDTVFGSSYGCHLGPLFLWGHRQVRIRTRALTMFLIIHPVQKQTVA